MKTLSLTLAALTFSTAAIADISVVFRDGAPKDRFTIANTGSCAINSSVMTIDLSKSKAGLIFDVTDAGAGVEVFQPFEFVSGAKLVEKVPQVRDGDSSVELSIDSLTAAQNIAFTIDVDDTLGGREITVSGSEIEGAQVLMRVDGKTSSATFGSDGRATLRAC